MAGRPVGTHRLTQRTHDRVIEAIRTGLKQEAAARTAGISETTFYRWKRRGELANKHWATRTPEQRRVDQPYRDFWVGVTRAWDEAHLLFMGSIRTAAVPHEVTETTTIVEEMADPKDSSKQIVVKTSTTTRTRREHDWRAAQAMLRARGDTGWNEKAQVEVTGAGGGPVVFKLEPDEIDLLSEAMGRVQGASSPPPDEPGA